MARDLDRRGQIPSTVTGDIEEQREDENGNQSQKQVRENAPCSPRLPLVRSSAVRTHVHRNLVLMLQVTGEFVSVVITVHRISLHRPQDYFFQGGRNFRSNGSRRRGIGVEFNVQDQEGVTAGKRRLACQHFVQDNPQRVQVAARVPAFAFNLLG